MPSPVLPVPALEQDRDQLAKFRAGDPDTLARVYHALVDDVFRIAAFGFVTANGAIRPERDPQEQRAIVQDVFVRAFAERARHAYDGLRAYVSAHDREECDDRSRPRQRG